MNLQCHFWKKYFIWICAFLEGFSMLTLTLTWYFVEVRNLNDRDKELIFQCSDKLIFCLIQKIQMWFVSDFSKNLTWHLNTKYWLRCHQIDMISIENIFWNHYSDAPSGAPACPPVYVYCWNHPNFSLPSRKFHIYSKALLPFCC